MPKTKDAFALRDFDSERILQCRWFKDFDLARGEDEYVLLSFYNVYEKPIAGITPSGFLKIIPSNEEKYFEGINENLDTIMWLDDRAGVYEALIERHMSRLNGIQKFYAEKFLSTEDKTYKQKFERTTELIKSYRSVLNSITALRGKISLKKEMLTKFLDKADRNIFAIRLRQARTAAGYTQTQLAKKIGMTQGGYTAYENLKCEPSVSTIKRLARILKRPTDWLLGMTP